MRRYNEMTASWQDPQDMQEAVVDGLERVVIAVWRRTEPPVVPLVAATGCCRLRLRGLAGVERKWLVGIE